jgi:hypothetical protein
MVCGLTSVSTAHLPVHLPDLRQEKTAASATFWFPYKRNHVGRVATFGADPDQPLIAVGRYIVCANGPKHHRAEVALAVLPDQGKGISSSLLRRLAIIGNGPRGVRISRRSARGQQQMLTVFEGSGFPIERSIELGVERVLLKIADEPPPGKPSSDV